MEKKKKKIYLPLKIVNSLVSDLYLVVTNRHLLSDNISKSNEFSLIEPLLI